MNTKEKILATALELYNTHGISAITSRHIAAEMGISAGNLHYHFRHTDEIIVSLYNRLSDAFSGIIGKMKLKGTDGPADLRVFTDQTFELIYQYRFIFLHAVEISLRIPSVRKDYQQLMKRRSDEFMAIFRQLIKKGVFRADLPEKVWKALVTQAFIVIDFWLSNNELLNHYKGKKAISHYSEVFLTMFYPYMTNRAQAGFEL